MQYFLRKWFCSSYANLCAVKISVQV